jgi:hypothetical protein
MMDAFTIAVLVGLAVLVTFETFVVIDYIRTGHHPYDTGEGGDR